jgi:hypothetical protein
MEVGHNWTKCVATATTKLRSSNRTAACRDATVQVTGSDAMGHTRDWNNKKYQRVHALSDKSSIKHLLFSAVFCEIRFFLNHLHCSCECSTTVPYVYTVVLFLTINHYYYYYYYYYIISFMQDIHTYIPETNHVSRVYSVAAICACS